MIRYLIKKDLVLACHPMTYVFAFFGVMLLIPSYPYSIAFFYVCLGIFFTFVNARENHDNLFAIMLPVSKRDIVKARIATACIFELFALVFAVPFAILSSKINPNGGNLAGIDANAAYFGFMFIMLGVFNFIFFPNHYKSAYKVGKPFVFATTGVFLVCVVAESFGHIPYLKQYFDVSTAQTLKYQLPILLAGIIIYTVLTLLATKKAAVNFEKTGV